MHTEIRVNWHEDKLALPLLWFYYLVRNLRYGNGNIRIMIIDQGGLLVLSARPIFGYSEISAGAGVGRRPVPWLLVPGPVAGVERLRADRG
jgi:hypothetical protein